MRYSCDGSYLISGSDDTNLRLWKAKSSEQMGVVSIQLMFNWTILFDAWTAMVVFVVYYIFFLGILLSP